VFTGIIQSIGTVVSLTPGDGDCELTIEPGTLSLAATKVGDSIAVSGVCLTIARLAYGRFGADVSRETLMRTTLGGLAAGNPVNLELAVRAGEPLGGHLVSGHIDGVARLIERQTDARSTRCVFELSAELARYLAPKGSVGLDGVSLTVNEVEAGRFGVNLIPHTLKTTTLGALRSGDRVNVEVDLVARYLERLLGASQAGFR
jgi:riboflavin synthase